MPVVVPTYSENYFQSLAADKKIHDQLEHLCLIPDVSTRKVSILSRLILLHFNDILLERNAITGKLLETDSQLKSLDEKLCVQCKHKLSISVRPDATTQEVLENDGDLEETNLRLSSTESSLQNDILLAPETQAINFQTNHHQNINHATVPETPMEEDLFYETDEEIIQSSCTIQSEKSPQTLKKNPDYQSIVPHSPIIGRTSLRNSPAVKTDKINKALKYVKPLKLSSPKNCRGKNKEGLNSHSEIVKNLVTFSNMEIDAISKIDDLNKSGSKSGKSTCSSNSKEASPNKKSLISLRKELKRESLVNTVPQNRFESQNSSELDDSNASPSLLNMVSKRNFGKKNVQRGKPKKGTESTVIDVPSSNNENLPIEQNRSTFPEPIARGYNGSKLGKLSSSRNLYNKKSVTVNKLADSQDYDTEPFQEKSIMFEAAKIVAAKKPVYDLKIDRTAVAKRFYKQTTLTESFLKVNSSSSVAKEIAEAVKRSAETKKIEDIRDCEPRSFNIQSDEREARDAPNKLLSGTILTESDLLLEINASSSDAHSSVSNNAKSKEPSASKRSSTSSDNSKKSSKSRTAKIDLSSPPSEESNNKKRKILGDVTANSKRPRPVFQPNDSFDMLPPKKSANSPDYPHVGPVVRQRNLRKQLQAVSCKQCDKYYEGQNLTSEQLKEKMQKCSRHRGNKFIGISNTPEDYWKTGFSTSSDSE